MIQRLPGITRVFALQACLAALAVAGAMAQTNQPVLAICGAVEKPLDLGLADILAMPRVALNVRGKDGATNAFAGVLLYDVVSRARPALTDKCCSNAANTVVVIRAADKYQALFSMPEIDPKFSGRQILLADHRDGQPLDATQGPLEIIVPDEKMHARWVRQVNLIEVLPLGDLAEAITNSSPLR